MTWQVHNSSKKRQCKRSAVLLDGMSDKWIYPDKKTRHKNYKMKINSNWLTCKKILAAFSTK